MSRVWKLAKVLRMAGGEAAGSKGKNKVLEGNVTQLLLALLVLGGCAAAGWLGTKFTFMEELLNDPTMGYSFVRVFFVIGVISSTFLSIPGIVNTFYMSSDLPVILVMPYTPMQIVMARVINLCPMAIGISLVASLPAGIGYALTTTVAPSFYLALILAFIAIPVISLCFAGTVMILIMTFVKFLRNTDYIRVIGIVIGAALYITFMLLNNRISNLGDTDAIAELFMKCRKLEMLFPVNFAMKPLMSGTSVVAVVEIVAITAVFAAVFYIVAKCFYLEGAISMQTTSGVGRHLNDKAIDTISKKRSFVTSYASKDFAMVRRNPAYLFHGFIYPFALPIIMLVVSGGSYLKDLTNANDLLEAIQSVPGSTCMLGIIIAVYFTLLTNAANAIINTPLSREGENFLLMKQFPIEWKDFISAKQRVSLRIANMTSSFYTVVIMLILLILKVLDIPGAICMIAMHTALLFILVDSALMQDLKKAYLNWENEAAMIKKSTGVRTIVWLLLGIFLPIGLLVASIFCIEYIWAMVSGCVLVAVIAAVLMNIRLYKKGPEMLARL